MLIGGSLLKPDHQPVRYTLAAGLYYVHVLCPHCPHKRLAVMLSMCRSDVVASGAPPAGIDHRRARGFVTLSSVR
jgi:hypothetical protein